MKKINYLTLMFFVIRSCFIGMSLNTLLYFSKNSSYISIIIGTKEIKKEEIAQIQNIISREMNAKIENIHIATK